MFQLVICNSKGKNYKINYKYEEFKHTKTKDPYCKSISCSLNYSFIFLFFTYVVI